MTNSSKAPRQIIQLNNILQILVSPSAAGGGSLQWFETFFPLCEALGCRIDYLATHDYHGDADLVMERLEMLHKRCILFH